MRFALLGPITVSTESETLQLAAGIPRTVLATLLLNANQVMTVEQLAASVWGDERPMAAVASLRNHVARLRRQLGPPAAARVRTVAPGYLVEINDGELDELEFMDGCRRGRQALKAGQWAAAADLLADALALWRGEPFAGMTRNLTISTALRRLEETRLLAWEGRNEADLRLGRHQELIATIRAQADAHPLQESFHGQLMLALYRAGRQAQALEVFQDLRGVLTEELGVEPSASIQQLHHRILNADPELAAPAAARSGTEAVAPRTGTAHQGGPRFQLPPDTRSFTGRGDEVDQLVAWAQEAPRGTGATAICTIDGLGGIGKSTLAVHAAHLLRAEFPDGQLFIDLHGHTSGIAPLTADDALAGLLRSLGVPPQLVPEGLEPRMAFYRDRLADTRTLIVLDNAVGAAQVRPLLPAASGCLVLITSRRRLTGLDDAHTVSLDVLPPDEALALLRAVAGPRRLPEPGPATGDLLSLCGYFPLAIRIIAARLRHRGALTVEAVVAQLQDEHSRLTRFRDEDRSLAAVFESSYAALSGAEQRLFRLLGIVPGADIDVHAVAQLIGTDHRTAEDLLESLLDHHLLTQYTPGRYRFHDLVRLYAQERGVRDVGRVEEREAPLARLLNYYESTALRAAAHLDNRGLTSEIPAPSEERFVPELTDRLSALSWMRAERDNLLDAIADPRTSPRHVIGLTAALGVLLYQEGPWSQAASLHRRAAAVAHEHRNQHGEAGALWDLGQVHLVAADAAAAVSVLSQALAIFEDLGDLGAQARALWSMGRARYVAGDFTAATGALEQALTIFEDTGHRLGQANALWDLGRVRLTTEDYPGAAALYEQALAIFQDTGHRLGQANALWDLGRVRLTTEDYPQAAALYEQALAIFQDTGHRLGQANALWDLGRVRLATEDYPEASRLLGQAFTIFQDLGNRLGEAYALWDLGRVSTATGDVRAAVELQQRALVHFRDLGSRSGEAHALHEWGRAEQADGQPAAAADLWKQALVLFQKIGDHQGEAAVTRSIEGARIE
ncbi:AfsR/SARP family transcriptional regulator [Streptacidiphilus sp. PAMC 29251]